MMTTHRGPWRQRKRVAESMTPLCWGVLDPLLGCIISGTPHPGLAYWAKSPIVRPADAHRHVVQADGPCASPAPDPLDAPPRPSPVRLTAHTCFDSLRPALRRGGVTPQSLQDGALRCQSR